MSDRSERPGWMGRPRVVALLLLLAVFAAGMLAGFALDRVADAAERPPRRGDLRRDHHGPPPIFAPGGRMAERLELTDGQRARIDAILTRDRARADSIFREMRPRLRARYDSTNAAIRAVLTPEQQEAFDRWHAERHARMHGGDGGRRSRRHGEPPPPPPGT